MSGIMPGIGSVPDPGFAGTAPGIGAIMIAAGFRLPPRIHDRAAAFADHAVIPFPRRRIDRLAH